VTAAADAPRAPQIGARARRKQGDLVVTGRGGYLDDIELPGMLHAAVLRSPHPHARIVRVDARPALERPGVRLAITGEDALRLVGPIPPFYDPAAVGGKTTEFRCLAVGRVVYAGEPVAAVVADSRGDAEAALEAIVVEYEPLPAVLDADEALREDAPRIFEDWDDNVVMRVPFADGDADRVLREAEHVLEGEVRIQRYQTAPMETRGYIAAWGPDGRLTFYGSSQNPHPLRSNLARMLDIGENRIRVVAPRVGGGFGHKFHGFAEEPLVCVLSREAGAPVKWIESRGESLLVGAREYVHRFAVAHDADGRILAIRDRIVGNVGALGAIGGWAMTYVAALAFPGPYKVEHCDVESVVVVTNKAPWNGARGYGKESAALAIERMIDLIAQRLDLDPAEVRRRNFIPPEDFPYRTVSKRLDSGNYAAALDEALRLGRYAERRADQERARAEGRLVGIGVGFELTPEGGDLAGDLVRGYDTSTVRLDLSGRATVLTGVTSPGTGNETGIAQIVADELGLSVDDVAVVQGDTDSCPYGFGNFSSRSVAVGGGSALLAAREVRERLVDAASVLLEVEPGALVLAGGEVRVAGDGGPSMRLNDLVRQIAVTALFNPAIRDPQLESTKTYAPTNIQDGAYPTFPYSAHLSVVEVDRETGLVQVLAYAAVDDCGTVINPMFVEGQFQGAIVMGIGGALWEDLPYGPDGRLRATSFKQYLLPRASDLPPLVTGSQVTPSPFTLLGTKGSGEGGLAGAVASVANAVNDAVRPLGVTINEMPLSAPRVLRAIRAEAGR
jgi:carbon-monoxide dehydrogenase large subunit